MVFGHLVTLSPCHLVILEGVMRIVVYLLIGGVIGAMSGALGIGGGVLLVPALIWLCGFKYLKAAGTSLAVLVPPIGLPAALEAYYHERVDLEAAVCIAAAFAFGAYFGARLVPYLPEEMLRLLLGLLMAFIATRFILSADASATPAAVGLVAVGLGWLSYLGLRALGRRHLTPPSLGDRIRRAAERHDASDYSI
jgi:hypothetical protein